MTIPESEHNIKIARLEREVERLRKIKAGWVAQWEEEATGAHRLREENERLKDEFRGAVKLWQETARNRHRLLEENERLKKRNRIIVDDCNKRLQKKQKQVIMLQDNTTCLSDERYKYKVALEDAKKVCQALLRAWGDEEGWEKKLVTAMVGGIDRALAGQGGKR